MNIQYLIRTLGMTAIGQSRVTGSTLVWRMARLRVWPYARLGAHKLPARYTVGAREGYVSLVSIVLKQRWSLDLPEWQLSVQSPPCLSSRWRYRSQDSSRTRRRHWLADRAACTVSPRRSFHCLSFLLLLHWRCRFRLLSDPAVSRDPPPCCVRSRAALAPARHGRCRLGTRPRRGLIMSGRLVDGGGSVVLVL